MTYCVGLKIDSGLVFMSDTRTNAGIDSISTFRKMHTWSTPDERVIKATKKQPEYGRPFGDYVNMIANARRIATGYCVNQH